MYAAGVLGYQYHDQATWQALSESDLALKHKLTYKDATGREKKKVSHSVVD